MKRLICLLLMIFLCTNLTSCKIYNNLKDIAKYKQECRTFAGYIVNEDRDAIYAMFNDECKEIDGFDEQFNTVLDFLFSFDLDYSNAVVNTETVGGGSTAKKGRMVRWSLSPRITHIYDAEGNEYEISFGYIGIDEDHPETEGVLCLELCRLEDINPGNEPRREIIVYIGRYFPIQNHERFYYYPED